MAAYARRALGQSVAVGQVGRVVFYTCGALVVAVPSELGYACFLEALLAHSRAELRQLQRRQRWAWAQYGQQKGGGAV